MREDMGVTYAAIDKYITTGEANEHDKAIIDRYHAAAPTSGGTHCGIMGNEMRNPPS